MKHLVIALILLSTIPTFAKKDPAVEQRKQFMQQYAAALEQAGVCCYQFGSEWKWGKLDKLTIYLRCSVAQFIQWEKQNVEPIRRKASELGFKEIRLLMPDAKNSATFPDGTWTIHLSDNPQMEPGYRGVHSE